MKFRRGIIVSYLTVLTLSWSAFAVGDEAIDHFEAKVRPILVRRCEKCHGAGKREGGLRLDSKSGWAVGGSAGPAILPGQPEQSLLIKAVRYGDEDLQMPPAGKLPDQEIAALAEWIRKGAVDPRGDDKVRGGPMSLAEAKNWWSLRPITRPPVPNGAGGSRPIDAFLNFRMAKAGVKPAAAADRRTLIRRATYDLTGLPPSVKEVEAFFADKSPDAFARVVDRLLASPHHGEAWGRHWLDLVRYADTAGENTDHPLPHAWRYRNWVIDALNRDMPFDEFVNDQIAGDIFASKGPSDEYSSRVVATGFLAIARRFGHDIDKDMHLTFEDTIDTVGRVFLGLTLGCARCHDHKYDPISARDYYALYGILESTRFAFPGCEPSQQPRDLVPLVPATAWDRLNEPFQRRINALDAEIRRLDEEAMLIQARSSTKTGSAPRVLAQGSINDGGSQALESALAVDVKAGQFIELVVSAGRDHGGDSTLVEWEIAESGGEGRRWSLTRDVVGRLLEANPHMDSDGRKGVWFFLDRRASPALLSESASALMGNAGLDAWRNGDTPSVFANSTQQSISVWTNLPPRSFFVHPGPAGPVAVGWSSPIDGKVNTTLRIADAHRGGTDGVGWRLESSDVESASALRARGTIAVKRQTLVRERDGWMARRPPREVAFAVAEGTAHDAKLQMRGDPEKPGQAVPRRWLEVLGGDLVTSGSGSGRRELAGWLTSSRNPLVARVMVNRIWQYHFGAGLAPTPSDFGSRGEPPVQPELLDWLAAEFIESGWRIKHIHRLIMLSDAYQRGPAPASEASSSDSTKQLFSSFARRRLSAEELRDSLLEISRQLDESPGGAHPFPPESSWMFSQHNPFAADYPTSKRGVYQMTRRNRRDPFLTLFDGADPSSTTPMRQETTVPTQALFVLNSPFFHEQAGRVASRVSGEPTDARRLELLFRLIFQRGPTAADRERAGRFLGAYMAESPGDERQKSAWAALARVLLGSNEFFYLD